MKKILILYFIYLLLTEIAIQKIYGPNIKIVTYGPKMTAVGELFNNSEDQKHSSIWITTSEIVSEGTHLLWGDRKIELTISETTPLVTATIDPDYYQKRGVYFLQLINPETNQKSNKVIFYVK